MFSWHLRKANGTTIHSSTRTGKASKAQLAGNPAIGGAVKSIGLNRRADVQQRQQEEKSKR
ncbi:MAG: hypothetical protein J6T80_07050 [Paludibacteraceae bacterium]|nr:hypothetical protein [Paludibacteraceae bacterium]